MSNPLSEGPATELHRPHFHFTPPKMWMNDPNGMVYYEGEYHLFYQHYPEATVWGPMHWGHAVSKDMMHWENLPIALYPDSLGLIFSGSAVVDWKNSSGFGKNGKAPLVAIFTQHNMDGEKSGRLDFQCQSIAYSNDNGRTWTKYAGNPVIPNTNKIKDFRDPKVIWNEKTKQWIMTFAAHDHVKFWTSTDLKHWVFQSDFGKDWGTHKGVWECPDLFPMPVEGTKDKKWVLLQSINPGSPNGGSGTQYFVGNFNGKTFTPDPNFAKSVQNEQAQWVDWGRDNYAGVTWSDIPKKDGRRIFMGWMSNWDYATLVPTKSWRSAMTLPRELKLIKSGKSYRLVSEPVKEFAQLRDKKLDLKKQVLKGEINITEKLSAPASCMEILLNLELPADLSAAFELELSNKKGETYTIGYDGKKNEFISNRMSSGNLSFSNKFASKPHTAPRTRKSRTLQLRLIFDVASCELFADNGATVLTDVFFPTEDFTQFTLKMKQGEVVINSGTVYTLKSTDSL